MLTPFCGTVDFERWEKSLGDHPPEIDNIPITHYWLIPAEKRPKMFMPHPTMSSDEMRTRTQRAWDKFYSLPAIWKRSACTPILRARLAFVFISKLYRQMLRAPASQPIAHAVNGLLCGAEVSRN